ncbi:MAG: hypothetical protein LBR60_04035 [Fibrobacter sp.]|nr:hypothetical protein [Fibrobacter sp.]
MEELKKQSPVDQLDNAKVDTQHLYEVFRAGEEAKLEHKFKQLPKIKKPGLLNFRFMHKLLEGAKGTEGELLREVWNKYEDKLKVHSTNSVKPETKKHPENMEFF